MYAAYFGLSEAPFSIAPDPAYLFMSDRHREALAHLTYGLGDSGGFVLLTGEVGTGKTTVCRSVMEQLPDNTQAAFILNPTLSSSELLATICDNLKIRYKKTGATLKYLTDKIQTKLIKNHQESVNTLLIIDEAQHLQPEVLEQLRLLTNLETNTKKLLQVILIGQPELQQLLQRRDLRQLAQRITARYHLLPLTKQELTQYIKHRLSVAQCTRTLFNAKAIATIHKISNGIPRLVNLLCNRALIIAYGNNMSLVNSSIVKKAAIEALGEDGEVTSFWSSTAMKSAYATIAIAIVLGAGYWFGSHTQTIVSTTSDLPAAPVLTTQAQATSTNEVSSDKPAQVDTVKARNNATVENIAKVLASDDQKNANDIVVTKNVEQQAPLILGYQPEKYQQQTKTDALSQTAESFDLVAESGVSDELLERFKDAINDINENKPLSDNSLAESVNNALPEPLSKMPSSLQDTLPTLKFEMHIFATDGNGWVRVNGEDKREGDIIASGVELLQILPQQVVLSFQNKRFTMPALSSW